MISDDTVLYWLRPNPRRQTTTLPLLLAVLLIVALMPASAAASTGYPNEITNIHVENATQTHLDVVWTTVHPSTSQVLIARDINYEPERWAPAVADPRLLTEHRVTVDHLVPYNALTQDGQYYIYVASKDVNGTLSTAPGPQDGSGNYPLLPVRTLATNQAGTPNTTLYVYGPQKVYAGSDLYFAVQSVLSSGPISHLYVKNQGGYNNGTDGVVTGGLSMHLLSAGVRNGTPAIGVHFSCAWSNASGLDANEQSYSAVKQMGYCYNGNNNVRDFSIRLRTSPSTLPGMYQVKITLVSNGQEMPATYLFSVLARPASEPGGASSYPPVPGLSTWETQMVALGHKWCDYRDTQNVAGNFVDNWGWTGDAWFYDGGRVFQEIDDYTANVLHQPNHAYWQHCASTLVDPYAQYQVATGGNMQSYNIFPYGIAMNWYRTANPVMHDAVLALANGPQHVVAGNVDPWGIRDNSYRADMWMRAAALGAPESPLLQRTIDKLIGNLELISNQAYFTHPFMEGLAIETLEHWYDYTSTKGTPDYRVFPVIKQTLDALWRDSWIPNLYLLNYNRYTLPVSQNVSMTALNDLVAHGYAWYWLHSGDTVEQARGDLLFQHTFDDPGTYAWSGKQFSQIFKDSFDFVRFRSGIETSAIDQANNLYSGAYADTEPPISERVNCDPNYYQGCQAGSIGQTTARLFWTTYEAADTQVKYGLTTSYGFLTPLSNTGVSRTKNHSVNLTGLRPNTTYHFRVMSRDAVGNLAAMHDLTFTTTP